MILYPTETTYAFGVDVFNIAAFQMLHELKVRDSSKSMSWLVPSIEVIEQYAEMNDEARLLAEHFLPGPLTLVLRAHSSVPRHAVHEDGTIGFRVSGDPIAMQLAKECEHPLTATSANISGLPTLPTPKEILAQCGEKAAHIDRVIDDGPRAGTPSTIVRCIGNGIEILREGTYAEQVRALLNG